MHKPCKQNIIFVGRLSLWFLSLSANSIGIDIVASIGLSDNFLLIDQLGERLLHLFKVISDLIVVEKPKNLTLGMHLGNRIPISLKEDFSSYFD